MSSHISKGGMDFRKDSCSCRHVGVQRAIAMPRGQVVPVFLLQCADARGSSRAEPCVCCFLASLVSMSHIYILPLGPVFCIALLNLKTGWCILFGLTLKNGSGFRWAFFFSVFLSFPNSFASGVLSPSRTASYIKRCLHYSCGDVIAVCYLNLMEMGAFWALLCTACQHSVFAASH